MNIRAPRTIAVLVGTDHHRFDRLVTWADHWATVNPQDTVVVQFGHSGPSQAAIGHAFLSPEALKEVMETADIVIAHGGPATISGARSTGHRPLVLARDPQLGEHVDDHQQRFARWSGQRSLVTCVESIDELDVQVDLLVADSTGTRSAEELQTSLAEQTSRNFGRLLTHYRAGENRASPGAPLVLHVTAPGGYDPLVLYQAAARLTGAQILGEVRELWRRGVVNNEDCNCGASFARCRFWQQVGKEAFGNWYSVDLMRLAKLRRTVESHWNVLRSALPMEGDDLRRSLTAYSLYYSAVYEAARSVSGADILIDSCRDPILALALSHNREIDLRMLRLTGKGDAARSTDSPGEPAVGGRWVTAFMSAAPLSWRSIPRARLVQRELLENPGRAMEDMRRSLGMSSTPESISMARRSKPPFAHFLPVRTN